MPQREYIFYVYILSDRSRRLYIGMTNDIVRRVAQHREHRPGAYTARYNIDRLVYFERFQYVNNAIAREKELKDWNRTKKIALIERENPTWEDLSEPVHDLWIGVREVIKVDICRGKVMAITMEDGTEKAVSE